MKAIAGRAKGALNAPGSGGPGQHLKGHFIEALDRQAYNSKNALNGKVLVARARPNHATYDASRIVNGRFAGAVQQKSSGAKPAVDKAIRQMNKTKPGSAARGSVRVPKDQVVRATKSAKGRVRVQPMDFTSEQATKKLDRGLGDVAKSGAKAGSKLRAAARAGAVGAAVNVAVGGISEAGALKRGELDGRDYAERRALDAVEGTGTGVVTTAVGGAASVGATTLIGASATLGTAAAGTGVAAAAVAAAPVVAGLVVATTVGLGIGKGFTVVRGSLHRHQERRRGADD
jgi:hypothetical protein